MSRLTYEDKKLMVRLYDEEHLSYRDIAAIFNINHSRVSNIISIYHEHGEEALIKKKNRKFSPEEKLTIISEVKAGASKTSAAIRYNIQFSMINNWLSKYDELGYDGLIDKPKGRPSKMKKEKAETKKPDPDDNDEIIRQKDERILELECEVEALKKLNALVHERKMRQTGKKQ